MKSEIIEGKPECEHPFPKLMKSVSSDLVILAIAGDKTYVKGTVVHPCMEDTLGTRSTTWNSGHFEDFDGTIQLSN